MWYEHYPYKVEIVGSTPTVTTILFKNMTDNRNNYENQKLRGLKRKYEAILAKGGKCEKCGYDVNIAALEFHHLNPEEKEF